MDKTEMIKILRARSGAGVLNCKKALDACDGDLDKASDWLREKGIATAAKKAYRIAAEGLCAIATDNNLALMLEMNSETDFVAKNKDFIDFVNIVAESVLAAKAKTVEEALMAKCGEVTINDYIVDKTATIGEKLTLRRIALVSKKDSDVFGTYLHMGGKIGVITVLNDSEDEALAKDVAMHIAAINPTYLRKEDIGKEEIEKESHIQLEALKNDSKFDGKTEDFLNNIIQGKINKWVKEICLLNQPFVKDTSLSVEKHLKNNKTKVETYVRYLVGEGLTKRQDNFADEVFSQVGK